MGSDDLRRMVRPPGSFAPHVAWSMAFEAECAVQSTPPVAPAPI